jgi:hypothetical protein
MEQKPLSAEHYRTIYISGPMDGYPDDNYPEFFRAAGVFRKKGFNVLNPPEFQVRSPEKTRYDYMRLDIKRLADADAVVLLQGWEGSVGAKHEVYAAIEMFGMPCFREWDFGRVHLNMNVTKVGQLHFPAAQAEKPELSAEDKILLQDWAFKQLVTPANRNPTPPPGKEETVLEEAERLVGGERRGQYGHPLDAQTRIGEFFTVVLRDKLKAGEKVTWKDVNLCMIGLKMARAMHNMSRDTLVDVAGYSRVNELCLAEEARRAA